MQEVNNFITPEECQELIEMIDANHTTSSVVVGGTDRTEVTNHRTSSTSFLDSNNTTVKSIHNKIAEYFDLDIKKGEPLQGQLYEVGQYFKPHNDFFDGAAYDMHCKVSGNRTKTLMIYLNENFTGGGTNFPNLDKVVHAKTGKALWWDNVVDGNLQTQYLHEGVAIEQGKKYIITSWWRENNWDGSGDETEYNNSIAKTETEIPTQKKSYVIKASEKITPQVEEVIEAQPKVFTHRDQVPKFTENGFEILKCPTETWNIINDSYNILKDKAQNEVFDGKEHIIKGGDTELLSFDAMPSIRTLIHNQLLPIHQDWIKSKNIEPSFIYGIRSYKKGSTLEKHYDRVETHHISSIIIVDKDLTCGCKNKPESDDWPLDIQGHDGEWYKVYAQPGDMILYESAVCEHGRAEAFGGTYFRNFYVHYKII